MAGIFITGTDTGVGKTFVTIKLGQILSAQGKKIGALKPLQSGHLPHESEGDAYLLKHGLDISASYNDICPLAFRTPVSPYAAALDQGMTINIEGLDEAYYAQLKHYDILFVEGAGGIAVPIRRDFDMADLAARWSIPIFIVARPLLGTINHTLLTINYAQQKKLTIKAIIFNQIGETNDPSIKRNAAIIEEISGIPVYHSDQLDGVILGSGLNY